MEEKLETVRREYGSTLSDLKINSKPHINTLTMLAEEYTPYASEVVRLIENRLQKAPSTEKLPIMYLMDSIVKNVKKGPYQQLFAKNLTNNFCGVFAKVNEKTRASLFKLRSTWNQYFASGILHALDVRVQKIDPAWPIMASSAAPPAPAPSSIHINPKFIKKPAPMESTASATVVQPTSTVVTSELSEKDRLEQEMRQSLISKQQELLQIQQQRLELELEQTKARLESQARELAAKNQALQEQQKQISQMANKSQAPTAPVSTLPATSLGSTGPLPHPQLQPSVVPTKPPVPRTLTAGQGLLGEAPTQKFPPASGGLLGMAPPISSLGSGGILSSSLVSQAPASLSNLPSVSTSSAVQSRNTINPRDPRLARDPRLRQAFEQQQQQQQKQQQEQLLLLQQKKQLLQQQQQSEQQQQQLRQQQEQQAITSVGNQPAISLPSSSPRSNDRRERDRRGKSTETKRRENKENRSEIKEKRKSPSPDREDEEKSKRYSKQDQLPPKKRARHRQRHVTPLAQ